MSLSTEEYILSLEKQHHSANEKIKELQKEKNDLYNEISSLQGFKHARKLNLYIDIILSSLCGSLVAATALCDEIRSLSIPGIINAIISWILASCLIIFAVFIGAYLLLRELDKFGQSKLSKFCKYAFLIIVPIAASVYLSYVTVIKVPADSASVSAPSELSQSELVYFTPNGEKYHRRDCPTLAKSKNVKSEAFEDVVGREPCSICFP